MGTAALSAQVPARTVKMDCAAVLLKMRTDIATDPGRLVLAMEDALTSSEACACPIVRAAVDLAGHQPKLIGELLIAAIHMLPASAAEITECVLLEAPEAASTIRATLAKELGEKSPELLPAAEATAPVAGDSGKEGGKSPVSAPPAGKEPVPAIPAAPALEPDEYEDYYYPAVGVNGIYFTSRAVPVIPGKTVQPEIIQSVTTKKKPPRRPVSPVTESSPG